MKLSKNKFRFFSITLSFVLISIILNISPELQASQPSIPSIQLQNSNTQEFISTNTIIDYVKIVDFLKNITFQNHKNFLPENAFETSTNKTKSNQLQLRYHEEIFQFLKYLKKYNPHIKLNFHLIKTITNLQKQNALNGIITKKIIFGTKQFPNAKQKIILFLIHGTFASSAKLYSDDKNKTYNQFKQFAVNLSYKKQMPIELVTFHWTGNLNTSDRHNAGLALANLINKYYLDENQYYIYTFTHSYGGHVVNTASYFIKRKINTIIHTAVPINNKKFTVKNYNFPTNFDFLYNLYSQVDEMQVLASLIETGLNKKHLKLTKQKNKELVTRKYRKYISPKTIPTKNNALNKIYNINILLSNKPPEHTTIHKYPTIAQLLNMETIIQTYYPQEDDLTLNIFTLTDYEKYKDFFPNPAPLIITTEKEAKSEQARLFNQSCKLLHKKVYNKEKTVDKKENNLFHEIQRALKKIVKIATRSLPKGFYPTELVTQNQEIKTSDFLITSTQ